MPIHEYRCQACGYKILRPSSARVTPPALLLIALPLLNLATSASAHAAISELAVDKISHASARFQWTTDVAATSSRVAYDSLTDDPSLFAYSTAMKGATGTEHGVTVGGLAPDTLYNFQVCSTSSAVETCSTPVQSFTTLAAPATRFEPPVLPAAPALVPMPVIDGQTFDVAEDCSDLQAIIDQAADLAGSANHQVLIQPTTHCLGNYTLPVRAGSGWIVVRSSAADSALPPEGVRVDPGYAAVMPTIESVFGASGRNAVRTDVGTSKWRFVGVQFTSQTGSGRVSLVRADPDTSDIVFDRRVPLPLVSRQRAGSGRMDPGRDWSTHPVAPSCLPSLVCRRSWTPR